MSQSIEDLTEACPRCHAGVGQECRNPATNTVAHMCCVSRLKKVMV